MPAQPSHCAQILFCLFNQEAAASDPTGIHKYSEDLVGAIVPNPAGEDSARQLTNRLADRLASAEQAARAGSGKLVPEAAVVKAFNDLMQEVGAPLSMRASEASVHGFREHAASIKAFPALFSAGRNGAKCNPGEAVFLLSLLLSDNGALYEGNLDSAVALMQWDGRNTRDGAQSQRRRRIRFECGNLLSWYSLHHNRKAAIALFDQMTTILGF